MNALTQYIDLFKEHRIIVDEHSSGMLNAMRDDALKALENMTLPKKGSENYETTDLEAILAPDYGVNISRVNLGVNPSATFHCGVPNLSSSLLFQINDMYAESSRLKENLPDGVFVGSIREFSEKYQVASSHYGKLADLSNPIVALNTLLVQDGVAVYVPSGVKVEKPLQLVNILSNTSPLMAVRRLLVIVEDGADVKLLSCDHTQSSDIDFLALQTIELFVGKNAMLDFYDLEESTQTTRRLSALYLSQSEGSNVLVDGITLYNGDTRNEYYCRFEGREASLRLLGMGIEDCKRHLDTYSRVTHGPTDCKTEELFKYVVADEAVGDFAGLIHVLPGADRTEAYQSNRNIVDSDRARMFSKPQLEIYNDDVKCSHGTATGQLDDMQVFYMRTRGLSEAQARLLLKQAFMADVIDGVRLDSLKDRLHMLVERRFNGSEMNCGGSCAGCNP